MEEDEEEVENPDLPVFSVIVKEENRNNVPRDPLRVCSISPLMYFIILSGVSRAIFVHRKTNPIKVE